MSVVIEICTHESPSHQGGPFIWAQRIPLELRKLGFTVRFKLLSWNNVGEGLLSNFLKNEGFEVAEKKIGFTEDTVYWLLNEFKKNRPDVLIISLDVHSYYATKYLKKAGIPVIGIIRSDDNFYHGLIDKFVFGRNSFRVTTMVSVSEYLSETIRSKSPDKITLATIPSGTIVPFQKVAPPQDKLRLVYVGRIVHEQKRILDLTNAFIKATQEIEGVEAYIIGGGPEEDDVIKLIESSNASHVKFLGFKDSSQLIDFMLSCHVVVLLSDYEGTPTSIMEGMACGCVPVCLEIRSGIPELVHHEKTGLLVQDREHSFVQAIARLKANNSLWTELSENARSLIEKKFSTSVCATKWSQLIQSQTKNQRYSKIKIPRYLYLPSTHIYFAHQDKRKPSGFNFMYLNIKKRYSKIRIQLGALKRKLF